MRKLSKIIAPALFASLALGATIPAQAQTYNRDYNHGRGSHATPARAESIRNQIDELQRRIERNDGRDRISEREARGLRMDVRRLHEQFRAYNRNGLNDREFRTLQNRIAEIRSRLHIERHDRDGRRY